LDKNYYRPEIDGLRAVSVVAVILAHADVRFFQGGFIGVDVFFVISGYLITKLIVERLTLNIFSYRVFFLQRMRRLLPAQFFMLFLTFPLFWFVMLPDQFATYVGSIFSTSVLLSNFYFLSQLEYWQSSTDLQPLAHMWSLSIEEQYYLMYPVMLVLALKVRHSWILIAIVVSTLLGFAWAISGITDDPGKNYFHSFSRFWQLGFGCGLALIMRRYSPQPNQLLSLFGFSLIVGSIFFFNEGIRWPSIATLAPVLGATIFIAFADVNSLIGRVLTFRPILYVGVISYSLYLWHQPIFALIRTVSLAELDGVNLALSIVLLITISSFSYYLIERPIRYTGYHGRSVLKNRHFVYLSVLFTTILAGGSLWSYVNIDRLNSYRSTPDLDLQKRLALNVGLSENCASFDVACRTSDAAPVLVWGDSHAMHLVPAITTPTLAVDFEQRTQSGCPPYLNYAFVSPAMTRKKAIAESKHCIDFNTNTLQRLQASSHVQHVVLASPFLYSGTMMDSDGNEVAIVKQIATMQEALSSLIKFINSIGLKVTLVSPAPSNGNDLGLCSAKLIKYGYAENVCDFDLADTNFHKIENFFTGITGDFQLIRLKDTICPDGVCRAYKDGKIIYRDRNHLSIEGAVVVAESLRNALLNTEALNQD